MARKQDEIGVWWSDIDCPICGEAGPNQQSRVDDTHLFICSECSSEFRDG